MRYIINIFRPQTPDENILLCKYVDKINGIPYNEAVKLDIRKITGSQIFSFNYRQFMKNEWPVIGGGANSFWFTEKADAEDFIKEMAKLVVKPDHFGGYGRQRYEHLITNIKETE